MDKKIAHAFIKELAKDRENLHKHHSSSRPFSKDYEYVGLLGEFYFSLLFKLPFDLVKRPSGDRGVDFKLNKFTIDVKTYRKPYNLLHEKDKKHADILVLAGYKDDTIKFYGWEYAKEMLKCPAKDFGYGVVNHYKHASKLHNMEELKKLLNKK